MLKKKIVAILTVFLFLVILPVSSGLVLEETETVEKKILERNNNDNIDGNFTAFIVNKKDDEEGFEAIAGLACVYKNRGNGGLFGGKIFNAEREQIGSIRGIFGRHIFIAKIIKDDHNVPVIGFISFREEQKFVGRGMSFIGPALYFAGKYNEY